VDAFFHLESNEGEEAANALESFAVGADDGDLGLHVGEGDAEEGVECRENKAELVEDGAEGIHQDLLLHYVGIDQRLELG
jgi:hypothetical protein